MARNFRIRIIHEQSGEIRQIKEGKSVSAALRQAKDEAFRLETCLGGICLFELTAGDKTKTAGAFKVVRAWLAENTEPHAVSF